MCRRSWKCTASSTPALAFAARQIFVQWPRLGVDPFAPTNTRPAGPGSAYCSRCVRSSGISHCGRATERMPAWDFGSLMTSLDGSWTARASVRTAQPGGCPVPAGWASTGVDVSGAATSMSPGFWRASSADQHLRPTRGRAWCQFQLRHDLQPRRDDEIAELFGLPQMRRPRHGDPAVRLGSR